MKNYNILLVGSGNFGSRHLQSIVQSKFKIKIFVVEPRLRAVKISKKRIFNLQKKNKKIYYYKNFNFQQRNFDIAIISTTSNNRKTAVIDLLKKKIVKFMIIEKVAFQSIKDFEKIIQLLEKKRIKAWVNCPRRMMKIYKIAKKIFSKNKKIKLVVKGENWNLASNAIHFIDLFSFISRKRLLVKFNNRIENKIYYSKRKNFLDLSGVINAASNFGDKVKIVDTKQNKKQIKVSISNSNYILNIFEKSEIAHLYKKKSKKKDIIKFNFIPQSYLTNALIEKLLKYKKCDLTEIKESFKIHQFVLGLLNYEFSKILNKKLTNCPIT